MKFELTALACGLALTPRADHAVPERLGIKDASVLKTGVGVLQDDAAGEVDPRWINRYASIRSGRATLHWLQVQLDQTPGEQTGYVKADAAAIVPGRKRRLDTLTVGLKTLPAKRTIKATGYTDCPGNEACNLRLPWSRARTVEPYPRPGDVALRSICA
jgi:outer membrane protein OmpA-like peptidoglycan-associated protein